jgi:hypothetical protein
LQERVIGRFQAAEDEFFLELAAHDSAVPLIPDLKPSPHASLRPGPISVPGGDDCFVVLNLGLGHRSAHLCQADGRAWCVAEPSRFPRALLVGPPDACLGGIVQMATKSGAGLATDEILDGFQASEHSEVLQCATRGRETLGGGGFPRGQPRWLPFLLLAFGESLHAASTIFRRHCTECG